MLSVTLRYGNSVSVTGLRYDYGRTFRNAVTVTNTLDASGGVQPLPINIDTQTVPLFHL